MNALHNTHGTIIQINFKLLYALAMVLVAIWIWPQNPQWWAFGLMSVVLCMSAFALVINTVRSMWALYLVKKASITLSKRGKKPKSAKLVSDDDLSNEGMM